LASSAALKGLKLVATGDFTHPQWRREIGECLEEAEEGLFKLKKKYVPEGVNVRAGFGPEDVRFILNVEISSIYKKSGKTRKVHNLVFMPDLAAVDRFNTRLEKIGNIRSDGRPILGLDARDLLETALEVSDQSFLTPAHIWTPWFSLLGSKSGFDSVEECFEDLAGHIFSLETGLSSDPEMNYRVSSLDGYTLISNSDTHSPGKLGREANIFQGTPDYPFIRESIRKGYRGELPAEALPDSQTKNYRGFVGTLEFFPEEGKYHLDGHRKCSIRMTPEQTRANEGLCPKCGEKVTVGVMNRTLELSDRAQGAVPKNPAYFRRLLPLNEVISQSIGVGPQSKKVRGLAMEMIRRLGPELEILWRAPLDELAGVVPDITLEGLKRARQGKINIDAGYDGRFGEVRLFSKVEQERLVSAASVP
jgi:uncharacterized protein (TIGR00375 family)